MNEAIRLAIEGGWRPTFLTLRHLHNINDQEVVLEPEFWTALGKALGWTDCDGFTNSTVHLFHKGKCWSGYAHHYLDVRLTGGDEEAFWKGLLDEAN